MNYFQELAAKYDGWFHTPHGQYVSRYEHKMIAELVRVRPGMKVADIGCGTGIYTQELLMAGAEVTGVDISPEMLAIAAEKTRSYTDRVHFLQGDAAALPFPDDSFDAVISITAMEFFEQPHPCLMEMYRILRPGGQLVVATLNRLSLWSMQRRIKARWKHTIFSNTRFYSIEDLRRLFVPQIISAWRGGIFIPPFAPQWLICHPDKLERWGQKYLPEYGAFIVVQVTKPAVEL